jgi:hypothetical protein
MLHGTVKALRLSFVFVILMGNEVFSCFQEVLHSLFLKQRIMVKVYESEQTHTHTHTHNEATRKCSNNLNLVLSTESTFVPTLFKDRTMESPISYLCIYVC